MTVGGVMKIYNRKAFSLIEASIVLVIFGLIVIFALATYVPVIQSSIAVTKSEDLKNAMNRTITAIHSTYAMNYIRFEGGYACCCPEA
jgi:prepilin-type N-terminal cleavage/methylation domain-containing protein